MDVLYFYVTRFELSSFRKIVWMTSEDKETLYLSKVRQELNRRGIILNSDFELNRFIEEVQLLIDAFYGYDFKECFNKLDVMFEVIAELQ